jgi:hypothetical protein
MAHEQPTGGEPARIDVQVADLPVPGEVLDGLRVGGARNYGFGEVSVADSQLVDVEALDYARLTESDVEEYVLELVSPYVLSSTYPGADEQSVPWWWNTSNGPVMETRGDGLRRREEWLVSGADMYTLECVDHGQVVGYAGDDPVGTAKNGVLRVGTHSRFGFGEFRIRPASEDRVAERSGEEIRGEA